MTLATDDPGPGFADEPRRPPGAGEIRSADRGRAADYLRTRRADRAQPGLHRRREARHPDEVRIGAPRLHPADIQELKRILFDPRSHQVFMSAMEAAWWLNDQLQAWLGEKNTADTLTQSVPHNITSEMGLALLDVADAIRPHPAVVAFLRHVEDED